MGVEKHVVNLFKKVGARCRKRRGVYECWKGYVKAKITASGIEIRVPGEFRLDYATFHAEDNPDYTDQDLIRDLEEITGASVELDIPCSRTDLVFEFSLDDADRAVSVFNRMAERDMWCAITNITGELRLYKDKTLTTLKDWLRDLQEGL